ncbi:MAG: ABC transporter permease, partial [Anaerolineales bacterium]|nr:ABC transporter permease [Anaerolineales bacterium]
MRNFHLSSLIPYPSSLHPTFIYRQITSSLKQTAVFVLCVALSIVTLVALGGFGESVNNSLLRDARKLLAGDIIIESGFPFEQPLLAEIENLTAAEGIEKAFIYEFLTIVRLPEAEDTLLTSLKVVENGYPFYGEVELASGRPLAEVLTSGNVIVEENLLERMNVEVGDPLIVGSTQLTIADVLLFEPDRPVNFFAFGPRVFGTAADLAAMDLIRPGSRVEYKALLKVPDESQLEDTAAQLAAAANPRQERIETFRTAQTGVQIFFDNFILFLSLIGIFTLMLAGIGIQSSLTAFLKER